MNKFFHLNCMQKNSYGSSNDLCTYVEKLVYSVILQVLVDAINVLKVLGTNADLLHLFHQLLMLSLFLVRACAHFLYFLTYI